MNNGILFALGTALCWGTSPLLLKNGLRNASVGVGTVLQQAVITVTLLISTLFTVDHPTTAVSGSAFLIFLLAGVVGSYLGRTLFVRGVDEVGPSRAQLLKNAAPLITVILAIPLLGESMTPGIAIGGLGIITGLIFVTGIHPIKTMTGPQLKALQAPLLAAVCYGIVPILKKLGLSAGGDPIAGALIVQLVGLVLLLVAGRFLRVTFKWERIPLSSFLYFVSVGVLQAIGSICTFYALSYAPAVIVVPIWNAQPLVTMGLSRLTLSQKEPLAVTDFAAAILIVLGVVILYQA